MKYIALASAVLLAVLPQTSFAWGFVGHRLVAQQAENALTPATKAEIAKLLVGEKEPTLAGISTWADELRGSDPELGKKTGRWHYVNMGEDQCKFNQEKHCHNGNCVIDALNTQTAILADRSQPFEARQQALKFVVHFAGDLHQPLHNAFGNDKGGNDYQIQFNNKGSNLHSFWDSGLLKSQNLTEEQWLQRLQGMRTRLKTTVNMPTTTIQWSEAACNIAVKPGFYPQQRTISPEYIETHLPTAELQLHIAGARLAKILEGALSTSK